MGRLGQRAAGRRSEGGSTYVDSHGIIAIEFDDGLTTRLIFDPVLGPEPGHHLDGVCTRHCGAMDARRV